MAQNNNSGLTTILLAVIVVLLIWIIWSKEKTPATPAVSTPLQTPSSYVGDNGHDWVDLGLSVKWATCNIGASSPVAVGSDFVWGETKSRKSSGSWSKVKYCTDASGENFSKYNRSDHRTVLEKMDDAASANWGGGWRIPTEAEWGELSRKCRWSWTYQGSYGGYLVTSKKNGNSIFLPAHYEMHDPINDGAFGHYLTSSIVLDRSDLIRIFTIVEEGGYAVEEGGRCFGFKVRPVLD